MGAMFLCTQLEVTSVTTTEVSDLTDVTFDCNKDKSIFESNICGNTPNGKGFRTLAFEYGVSATTRNVSLLADSLNVWLTAKPTVELTHSDPDTNKRVTVTITNTSMDSSSTRSTIGNATTLELKFTSTDESAVTVTTS